MLSQNKSWISNLESCFTIRSHSYHFASLLQFWQSLLSQHCLSYLPYSPQPFFFPSCSTFLPVICLFLSPCIENSCLYIYFFHLVFQILLRISTVVGHKSSSNKKERNTLLFFKSNWNASWSYKLTVSTPYVGSTTSSYWRFTHLCAWFSARSGFLIRR